MKDIRDLPLIILPFKGTPPAPGLMFRDRADFVYELLERKPHTNRDGSDSWLLTFRCTCAQCGEVFLAVQGPSRANLPRRCPPHAKGKGREKVHPWGRAPLAASGKPDSAIVGDFLESFDTWVDGKRAEVGPRTEAGMDLFRARGLVYDYFEERWPTDDEGSAAAPVDAGALFSA